MTAYHCRIAVGYYARKLSGGKVKPHPVAVLSYLWLYVADPYAVDVHVRVALDDLYGVAVAPDAAKNNASARLRQLVQALHDVGALSRAPFGFVLHKPALAKLDDIARQQLSEPGALLANAAVQGPRTATEREVAALAKQERRAAEREARERGAAVLEVLGKQRSDVRDGLAHMLRVDKDTLRYTGKGSQPVQHAIDWLASTGASWSLFGSVCKLARYASDDRRTEDYAWLDDGKPDDMRWLFDPKHADYLGRLIAHAKAAKDNR